MAYRTINHYVKHPASTTDGSIPLIEVQADIKPNGGRHTYPHPCIALGHALQLLKETERHLPEPVGLKLGENGDVWVPRKVHDEKRWRSYDWVEIAWDTRDWSVEGWAGFGLRAQGEWAVAEMQKHGIFGTDKVLPINADPKLRNFQQ